MLVKLKDLLLIKNSSDYKHLPAGDIPVIGTGGVMLYVNKFLYDKEAILLPRKGSLNNIMYINQPFWTVDTMFYAIPNSKIVNAIFLYYRLKLFDFTKYDVGSTIPSMTASLYYSLSIDLPPLEIQNKIASILSSIDVQIERNSLMVKKLQVLTQSIYSYWFNQFEFPNEEGKPYKSSGGEMVWNEELKREIPKDWEVKQLKELSTIILGGTPSRNIDEYWNNGNISWLNSGEIVNFPIITSSEKITLAGLENSATEYMKSGTVVVSITGNIRASILGIDSCANQSVVGIIENKTLRKEYLYPYISAILSKFIKMSTGNCQQHINKKTLEENQILIPKKSVILNYYNKVEKMYSLIISTALQTNKLLQLKEKLLPLLINGQLI